MGFINGTCMRSDYAASNLLVEQWDRCNVVVLSWILGSLSQDVYLGHVFFDNASVVWNELKDTYDRVDGSIVILSFLVLPEGCDPLALVESLTPVECNTRLLETMFDVKAGFVFSVDGSDSANLTFLSFFL
ncbi:hypothetical protein Tco_1127233, partial [Tanacetum coccineum]